MRSTSTRVAYADAIQRAAYVFTERFALTLTAGEGVWHCVLDFASEEPPIAETVRAFRIEILDYMLRERIRKDGTRSQRHPRARLLAGLV